MTSPETKVEQFFRLNPLQKKGLAKLGIKTLRDLLYHFPARYNHIAEIKNISELQAGDEAVVYGKISSLKTTKGFHTKIPYAEATVEDRTGKIKAVWFRQQYIAKMFQEGALVKLSGSVSERKGVPYLANPEIEKSDDLPIDGGNSLFSNTSDSQEEAFAFAVYPESRGITSRWFYHAVEKIIRSGGLDTLPDPFPEEVLKKYNLPTRKTALIWIHRPKNENDSAAARKRFAFEEIFFIQLTRQMARRTYEEYNAPAIQPEEGTVQEFLSRFPFSPTEAQTHAIQEILKDMGNEKPMLRLLEGDVGSGKTFVAAAAAYATFSSSKKPKTSFQTAYMAPTEILANQHFQSFIKYFSHLPITIALITGSGCKKFPSKVNPEIPTDISRSQLLKWVADGSIDILFGTHALIQKSVTFRSLALAVIDEQHRFGTEQRAKLARKNNDKKTGAPHLLSMTATPIPRTLALTIYGDLDLTLLDQMPAGRKNVITEIVTPAKRKEMYEHMRSEIRAGRQAYIICPRIDEPDPEKELALNAKSVKEESATLQENVFPEFSLDILHGKMTPKEKESAMKRFEDGKTHILVATSVVEVGVNVPNATLIAIEGAERFGLAQLHQLRGRVLRGTHQSYCYLLTESKSENTTNRLRALTMAKNGFELAEMDLSLRGAGELSGKRQWGVSDLGMEAIRNLKMVEAARTEAKKILDEDPSLSVHHEIQAELDSRKNANHFE